MTACPSCGSEEVRRSRKKSLLTLIQSWRGLRRYRCRECRRLFYGQLSPGELDLAVQRSSRARQRLASKSPRPSDKQKLRRHATELLLFLCLVVIFYAALKYLAHVP